MEIINIVKADKGESKEISLQSIVNVLKKQLQSSNINILLGAGFSSDVAKVLGNIETDLSRDGITPEEVITIKKEFFKQSILPMANSEKIKKGEKERIRFFAIIKKIIEARHSSILHKIVNIYTTNYDLLIESALEKSHNEYVDGFSGKVQPVFSTSNYGIILSRQTSIASMTSEIVTFNVYKVHGSLNWKYDGNDIHHCNHIDIIKEIDAHIDQEDFAIYYDLLSIINPTKDKLKQTVLSINYYDQLRMYCNELEKNNTILLVFGFSFADEHICEMTKRALKGNPTLTLIIFSFNEESTMKYEQIFESYSNVNILQLVTGDDAKIINFTQEEVNNLLEEVYDEIK